MCKLMVQKYLNNLYNKEINVIRNGSDSEQWLMKQYNEITRERDSLYHKLIFSIKNGKKTQEEMDEITDKEMLMYFNFLSELLQSKKFTRKIRKENMQKMIEDYFKIFDDIDLDDVSAEDIDFEMKILQKKSDTIKYILDNYMDDKIITLEVRKRLELELRKTENYIRIFKNPNVCQYV